MEKDQIKKIKNIDIKTSKTRSKGGTRYHFLKNVLQERFTQADDDDQLSLITENKSTRNNLEGYDKDKTMNDFKERMDSSKNAGQAFISKLAEEGITDPEQVFEQILLLEIENDSLKSELKSLKQRLNDLQTPDVEEPTDEELEDVVGELTDILSEDSDDYNL